MPIDVTGKRRKAAEKIRAASDLVLELVQPVYTGDIKTGEASVYASALLESAKPSRDRDVENRDLVFTVAALQSDSAGVLTATPLVVSAGDLLVWDGRRIPVLRPNAVAPTGSAIIYDRLVAGTRQPSE